MTRKKKKPDKPPLDCWDCLDCPKSGYQETHWSRFPGPHFCELCGGELVKRIVKQNIDDKGNL